MIHLSVQKNSFDVKMTSLSGKKWGIFYHARNLFFANFLPLINLMISDLKEFKNLLNKQGSCGKQHLGYKDPGKDKLFVISRNGL